MDNWIYEYWWYGRRHFEYLRRFPKSLKICFVLLTNLDFLGGEMIAVTTIEHMLNTVAKHSWRPIIIRFLYILFVLYDVAKPKYGGIHDGHFENIQTAVTFLFLNRFL